MYKENMSSYLTLLCGICIWNVGKTFKARLGNGSVADKSPWARQEWHEWFNDYWSIPWIPLWCPEPEPNVKSLSCFCWCLQRRAADFTGDFIHVQSLLRVEDWVQYVICCFCAFFCEVHFFDGWLERHHQEEVTLSMSLLLLNWMKSNSRKTFKRFLQFLQSKSHSQVLIPFITGFVRIPGAIFNAAQGRTGFLGCKMTREFEMLNY